MSLLQRLPFPLGSRPTGTELTTVTGVSWDVAIGGLPFMLTLADEPLRRQTNDYQREQIDTAQEAGEQSLTGWWLRSQARFDDGAGVTYYEPLLGDGSEYRFHSSVGLDVFSDPGGVTLCKRMDSADISDIGTPKAAKLSTSSVEILGTSKYGSVASSGTYASGSASPTGSESLAIGPDGAKWVAASGAIYKDGVSTWTTAGTTPQIWWVKSRLFAAQDGDLLELSPAGGNLDTETPLTIPEASTSGWTWVDVVETPNAVWAIGIDDFDQGRVFVITVDDASATVIYEAATLPVGETVLCAYGYLDYIAIGTDRGIRVCPTSGTQVVLGPVLGEDAVYAITAYGDSLYGATQGTHDGYSGVLRVDLSNELGGGYYPWALDTYTSSTAQPVDICVIPGSSRLVLLTTNGLFVQSTTNSVASGWLRTGFIRWGTWESKWLESLSVRADTSSGSVTAASVDNTSTYNLGTFSAVNDGKTFTVSLPGVPLERAALEFTLTPSATGESPTFRGYQLRAVPIPRRQRLISFPVRVHDVERDRYGQEYGFERFGAARQFGLEMLEEDGVPVVFQDFRTGETRRVLVQQLMHVQQFSPDREHSNAEGVTMVSLLALDSAQLGGGDFDRAGGSA